MRKYILNRDESINAIDFIDKISEILACFRYDIIIEKLVEIKCELDCYYKDILSIVKYE